MQHFTLLTLSLAILGVVLSWSMQLATAYLKVVKRKSDRFDWGFYFRQNAVELWVAFLSAITLVLIVPWAMEEYHLGNWSDPIAIGCGATNVQLIKLAKLLFEKQAGIKTGTDEPA